MKPFTLGNWKCIGVKKETIGIMNSLNCVLHNVLELSMVDEI